MFVCTFSRGLRRNSIISVCYNETLWTTLKPSSPSLWIQQEVLKEDCLSFTSIHITGLMGVDGVWDVSGNWELGFVCE